MDRKLCDHKVMLSFHKIILLIITRHGNIQGMYQTCQNNHVRSMIKSSSLFQACDEKKIKVK